MKRSTPEGYLYSIMPKTDIHPKIIPQIPRDLATRTIRTVQSFRLCISRGVTSMLYTAQIINFLTI